jgi:hypothetical protein
MKNVNQEVARMMGDLIANGTKIVSLVSPAGEIITSCELGLLDEVLRGHLDNVSTKFATIAVSDAGVWQLGVQPANPYDAPLPPIRWGSEYPPFAEYTPTLCSSHYPKWVNDGHKVLGHPRYSFKYDTLVAGEAASVLSDGESPIYSKTEGAILLDGTEIGRFTSRPHRGHGAIGPYPGDLITPSPSPLVDAWQDEPGGLRHAAAQLST